MEGVHLLRYRRHVAFFVFWQALPIGPKKEILVDMDKSDFELFQAVFLSFLGGQRWKSVCSRKLTSRLQTPGKMFATKFRQAPGAISLRAIA